MQTVRDIFLLGLGFFLLIQSAKIFVNSSVNIAKRLKIPTMIIGLTIVAMGTSAPEVAISVSAAIRGQSDLAIANSVGSNLFNQLFIVGFSAMLFPIMVKMKVISRDFLVCASATVLLLVMVIVWGDTMPRFVGFAFLALFAAYMIVLVRFALKNKTEEPQEEAELKPLWHSILFAVLGVAVIIGAGQITVTSAVNLATTIGISERIVGLTIVSIGTSLPELVTTIIACRKKEGEFALGFIIGSSIFNILFVLGLAGAITPLTIAPGAVFDMAVLAVGTLAFFLFAKSSKKIVRIEGVALIVMYVGYMVWVVLG